MDIKEIQEQAYKKGFADGQATLGAEFMCKKIVSYEDVNTKYLEFPDGLRLIFREGKYVGWYVCNAVPDGKDTDVPTRWIPVTERKPDLELVAANSEDIDLYACLVTVKSELARDGMYVGKAWYDGDRFIDNDCMDITYNVTHWMHLPEPPKEGE